MQQRFQAHTNTRRRSLRAPGRVSLLVGAALVLLLVLGNIAALSLGDALRVEDPAYRQPPQWPFLERLLYHPPLHSDPLTDGTSGLDDLLNTLDTGPETPADTAAYLFTSRPVFTATTGRPYQFTLKANKPASAVRFEVDGPVGMTVNTDGEVSWTPAPNQTGRQLVTARVMGPDGRGAQQEFTVVVSARYHPLGTDERGRDLAQALVLGTRWTVLPGLVAVLVALLLGTLLGGLAGYYGGRLDTLLSYVARVTEAFPALVLLFLAAAIFQFKLFPIMIVLGLILMPGVARDVEAKVQTLKAQQFIEAAQELGLNDFRILWVDIIWFNARSLLLRRAFYGLALAVVTEVTLSYLRIGIQPPTASWGNLIFSGRELLSSYGYWLIAFPALTTVLAVLGYYLLGQGLEQTFRLKKT